MEILDRLKSMVGIGKPSITIEGVERRARPGEVLRGVVVLRGGGHDVMINDLALHLDEQQRGFSGPNSLEEPERRSVRQLAAAEMAFAKRMLRSDERLDVPFTLPLPTELEESAGLRCYALVAELEVPGLNPSTELELKIET